MGVKIENALSILPVLILLLFSCSSGRTGEEQEKIIISREDMVRANQFLSGKDMDLIRAYVNRRNWDIEFTGTGLGYQIYHHGTGKEVVRGADITIEFVTSLLNGRVCYSSEEEGPKTFRVGQGGVEAGLEEGVLMLREGDRARFVLPPFMAHGLIGDQDRIPPRAVVIYEVEVIGVNTR